MAISVAIGRARFELVRWASVPYEVGHLDPKSYPLLSGVDSVGNTIFNQTQLPRVLEEIRVLLDTPACTREMRASLEHILDLVAAERLRPHELLWIVGD